MQGGVVLALLLCSGFVFGRQGGHLRFRSGSGGFLCAICFRKRDLRNVRWIASALVMLGLIGTVVGFIQALLGVDPTTVADTAQIGKMVASLINGMGTALWTTFIGAVFNLWLLFNVRIIEAHRGA